MHHVSQHWCGEQDRAGFILPPCFMLLQVPSRTLPVRRSIYRIFWTIKNKRCFHLPQPCFQWKGQNDVIMLFSGRNCNEIVPQCEAVKSCWSVRAAPAAQMLRYHIVWSDGSAKEVSSEESSEGLPSGSAHINLPWFCPWFLSSPKSRCLKVHWSVRGDEE